MVSDLSSRSRRGCQSRFVSGSFGVEKRGTQSLRFFFFVSDAEETEEKVCSLSQNAVEAPCLLRQFANLSTDCVHTASYCLLAASDQLKSNLEEKNRKESSPFRGEVYS